MVDFNFPIKFSSVPVAQRSGGKLNINKTPKLLIEAERQNNRVKDLHADPYLTGAKALSAVTVAYPHVHHGTENDPAVHFMIAPDSNEFHTLKEVDMDTLTNMSMSALAFLETAAPNSMVLTHEADPDVVENPKKTPKSWKQIHWHMKSFSQADGAVKNAEIKKFKNIEPYGDKLVADFKDSLADNAIGLDKAKVSDVKTYGYDLAFKIPFPKGVQGARNLAESLKNLDTWLHEEQPIIANKYKDQILNDFFMDRPIYSIAMRKAEDGKLEIGVMPHIISPLMTIDVDGH